MSILKANNIVYCISQSIQKQKKHMWYTSKCIGQTKEIWIRPLSMFIETIDKTEKNTEI